MTPARASTFAVDVVVSAIWRIASLTSARDPPPSLHGSSRIVSASRSCMQARVRDRVARFRWRKWLAAGPVETAAPVDSWDKPRPVIATSADASFGLTHLPTVARRTRDAGAAAHHGVRRAFFTVSTGCDDYRFFVLFLRWSPPALVRARQRAPIVSTSPLRFAFDVIERGAPRPTCPRDAARITTRHGEDVRGVQSSALPSSPCVPRFSRSTSAPPDFRCRMRSATALERAASAPADHDRPRAF